MWDMFSRAFVTTQKVSATEEIQKQVSEEPVQLVMDESISNTDSKNETEIKTELVVNGREANSNEQVENEHSKSLDSLAIKVTEESKPEIVIQDKVEDTSTKELHLESVTVTLPEAEMSKDTKKDVSKQEPGYVSFFTPGNADRYHTVKSGDSLWAISNRYKISLADLMKWNNFTSTNVMIHPGDSLVVSRVESNANIGYSTSVQPLVPNNLGSNNQYHTIESGDSLWYIANKYGLTVDELVRLNGFSSTNVMIHPGQKLVVNKSNVAPSTTLTPKPFTPALKPNEPTRPVTEVPQTYTIVSGDSLWAIANRNGITVDELVQLNGWASSNVMIHPGQQVIVKKSGGSVNIPTQPTRPTQPAVTLSSEAAKRQKVLDTAKKYLGVPYVYGGNTPSQGFDCSGFVKWVFKEALGIDLPRVTTSQEWKGTKIDISEVKPGDLFFHGPRGGTTHVSIAVDKTTYIHAPYENQVVKYGQTQYFTPDFAIRVIQ